MTSLYLIAFLIIIYILINIQKYIKTLNQHIIRLLEELKNTAINPVTNENKSANKLEPEEILQKLTQELKVEPILPVAPVVNEFATEETSNIPKAEPTVEKIPIVEPEPDITEQTNEIVTESTAKDTDNVSRVESAVEKIPVVEPEPDITEQTNEPIDKQPISMPQATPKKYFNFERFIGENLINKIGISILIIGIGLFVKYAIDNGWINDVGRVLIGFLCGGILLGFAYRLRKGYRAFSSVLAGGAIVVFYFTVALAFREYNLFGQTTSFLLMVIITAFSVWLSIQYDRRELAILSLIGGLLTPFMVSKGEGNYHVLFTYIAILDIGILTLSLRKQWKELIAISFIGTQIIFWLYYLRDSSLLEDIIATHKNIVRDSALLIYTSIFYIIFLLMPLVQVFRGKDRSKNHVLHIITLVVNSFLFLLAGILLLQRMDADNYKGLLTALLAAVNFVMAMLLRNNQKDKILFHLFVGLTIGLVTLIAPMQFNDNNNINSITLFWATEAVLLLWLFQKSNMKIYYYGSLLLLAITLISILILHDLQAVHFNSDGQIRASAGRIFINKYFITRLYSSLAFVIYRLILLRSYNGYNNGKRKSPSWLQTIIGVIAVVLLFYTGIYEIYLYTNTNYTSFWAMAYSFVFVCILSFIIKNRNVIIILWVLMCLCYWANCTGIYGGLDSKLFLLVQNHIPYSLPVVLDWICFISLCGIFVVVGRIIFKPTQKQKWLLNNTDTIIWIYNVAAIITLSCATIEAINQLSYININISNKATITIVWSLCAFVQMWLGMHYKYKTLRIISLSLLGLALFKLFIYDLRNVSQGAKIVAFVVLGIVLLVLSFLYQKLKKILFEDDGEDER